MVSSEEEEQGKVIIMKNKTKGLLAGTGFILLITFPMLSRPFLKSEKLIKIFMIYESMILFIAVITFLVVVSNKIYNLFQKSD